MTGQPAGGEPLTIPLGSGEGRLVLEVMPGREPFGRADRRLLEDVARQVSRLTDLVVLNVALRESRTRIISAREEERRRLQRDLHDGLGPTLAGVTLGRTQHGSALSRTGQDGGTAGRPGSPR